jgi:hypothetical protein
MMNRLIKFTSGLTREKVNRWRVPLMVCAILVQILQFYIMGPILRYDGSNQLSATQQLLEGKSITIELVTNSNDMSDVQLRALTWWPPGFSLLAAPIYTFTQDLWWTMYVVDVLAVVLFFLATARLFWLLQDELSPRLEFYIWMFWAVLYVPVHRYTDQLTPSVMLWGVVCVIYAYKHHSFSWWLWFISGLLWGCLPLLHHVYLALVPIIPLVLFWWAYQDPTIPWRKALMAWLVGLACVLIPLFLWNISVSDIADRTTPLRDANAGGLLQNQLFDFHPFPADVFGMYEWKLGSSDLPPFVKILLPWALSLGILMGYSVLVWRIFRRPLTGFGLLMLIGLGVTVMTVTVLSFFTIRSPYLVVESGNWTFVGEMRYFAPSWYFIFIGFCYFLDQECRTPRLKKWQTAGVVLVICVGLLNGVVRFASIAVFGSLVSETPRGEDRIPDTVYHMVKHVQQTQKTRQTIVVAVVPSPNPMYYSWELVR